MKLKVLLPILFIVSGQLNATTTNLDVAKQILASGGQTYYYDINGEPGSRHFYGFGSEDILSSALSEDTNGKVKATIDFWDGNTIFRYQENDLYYSYVVDFSSETASDGLTKSGLLVSSPSDSINILEHGTELLELNKSTGLFSSSGIYVLNFLEQTCLSICDDSYPELTALNQVPLPSTFLLFVSSLLGVSGFTRFSRNRR